MADNKKKGDRGYSMAVTGAKGVLRILIVICLVIVLIFLGRKTYDMGYQVFNETPVDSGDGRIIKVTVTDDMSVYKIGRMLKTEGLLKEDPMIFVVQELISEYHGDLLPGTYSLKTSMTAQDMFPILAQDYVMKDDGLSLIHI